MHLNIRRLLSILSFVAFIAIAPAIVLYAIGYRSITTSIPQPVGVVVVNALPRKAVVSVNGTAYGTVPRSVPNLIPGVINVQVSKDGYQSWQKKLEIKPMQATDARDIKLIPTSQDADELASDAALFSISPDTSMIAIGTSKNDVFFIDQNGKFKTNTISFKSQITSMAWSSDSNRILIETKQSGFSLIQFSNQVITRSAFTLPLSDTHAQWDPQDNQSVIALTKKHELVRYSISTAAVTVLDTNCNAYTFINNQLVFQHSDNTLIKGNVSLNINQRALSLSASSSGEIAALLESGELIIIDKNNSSTSVAQHVLSATWSPDSSLLLLQTSANELDIYNFSNAHMKSIPLHESHVLVRLAAVISNPSWFPDNAHVLYQVNTNLMFSEIDPRDYIVTTQIAQLPSQVQHVIRISKDMNSVMHLSQGKNTIDLIRTWLVTKEDR